MKGKKNRPSVIIVAAAACLAACVAVFSAFTLGGNGSDIEIENAQNGEIYCDATAPEDLEPIFTIKEITGTTSDVYKETFVPSSEPVRTSATSRPLASATFAASTTTKPPKNDVTVPRIDEDSVSRGSATTGAAETPDAGAPLDASFAGLSKLGYDVIGKKDYIYNDDKDPNCMQKRFGYNELYDAGANLIDFSIDTVRLKFPYGNKDWMIQVWKGQYISGKLGTVGGEIGVYNRPKGRVSAVGHYDAAEKEDWLKMEMTVMWDEFNDGRYLPQLTRNYGEYWWASGFVDGQLLDRNDSSPLKILGRITFKDEEMAEAFEEAMKENGFSRTRDFDPNASDVYKRAGKDVVFIWRDAR